MLILAYCDMLVSAVLSVIMLANLGKMANKSTCEVVSYQFVGIILATIAIKRYYMIVEDCVVFDMYGFWLRLGLLLWFVCRVIRYNHSRGLLNQSMMRR